jgi:hypothetical protein
MGYKNSDAFARQFGAEVFGIPVRQSRTLVTAAELRTLSGATKVLVPAVDNHLIMPFSFQFDRRAGLAYTLNAVARIVVQWQSGAGVVSGYADAAGFLDSASAGTALTVATGSNISAYVGFSAAQVAGAFQQPLVLGRSGGTDLSGGSGSLLVTTWYRLLRIPQVG